MIVIGTLFPCIFDYINQNYDPVHLVEDIIITSSAVTVIALLTHSIIRIFNLAEQKGLYTWIRHPAELLLSLLLSFYLLAYVYILTRGINNPVLQLTRQMSFRLYITANLIAALFIYILEKSFNLYQLTMEKSAYAEQLQQEYLQMRLQALKSQVNPHFLFNSLSVLSSLIHVSPETSERFIIQLAQAYRYILEQKDAELVELKEELEFLDAYFFLLQIRFGNKIILKKNIELTITDWKVPPLTLQLLVENAVKHNKMSSTQPLTIELLARKNKIEVTNNHLPRENRDHSTGIGLNNIINRMAYVTGEKILITHNEKQFSVVIPLIKKNKT